MTTFDDVVPLSVRAIWMMVTRLAIAVSVEIMALAAAPGEHPRLALLSAGYLAGCGAVSLGSFLGGRAWASRTFTILLLADAAFLQLQRERLDATPAVLLVVAAHLVAVCLLTSFRVGLRLVTLEALVAASALELRQAGAFGWLGPLASDQNERGLGLEVVSFWLLAVIACTAGAVNERELRRRRHDAASLQEFATLLHEDNEADRVYERLEAFLVDQLQMSRVVVAGRVDGGWSVLSASGIGEAEVEPGESWRSALLDLPRSDHGAMVLRLDPERDPVLSRLLPDARRLVALSLGADGRRCCVAEDGHQRGARVERRVIDTSAQAAVIASLALERTTLLDQAKYAAQTDGLTGLANRRTFDAGIGNMLLEWERSGSPFALIIADIDHFKSINDRFGHQVGDEVLTRVAQALAGACRPGDMPARYGGEEFAILLPDVDAKTALVVAARMRRALHRLEMSVEVTASFGVASVPADARDSASLIRQADAALLRAKAEGRDRVNVAKPESEHLTGVPGEPTG